MSRDSEPLIVPKQFREELENEDETVVSPHKKRTWTKSLYDVEHKVYFGRTCDGWGKMLLAYLILYALLAIWVGMMFQVFNGNLSRSVPRWFAHQPTFGITPCSDEAASLCVFSRDAKNIKPLIKANLVMLRKYGNPEKLTMFGPCNRQNNYGYDYDEPCFFLKLNRLIGYVPEVYDRGAELPKYAPYELRKYIDSLAVEERLNRVWISCELQEKGVNISYYPGQGVKADLLRMTEKFEKNPDNYKHKNKVEQYKALGEDRKFYNTTDFERIIAVQFSNLPPKPVTIDCFMWAKNIRITEDPTHGAGKVSIRLLRKGKGD